MKNSKFKSVLFSIFILLSFCALLVFTKPVTIEQTSSLASVCVKGETRTDVGTDKKPNEYMYTEEDMGNIPFGLFVSSPSAGGYNITDYFPAFTKSTKNESSAVINCYYMDVSSRPTFLLSSRETDEMYDQTVTFVFNDLNGKVANGTETNIPETGYLNLTATLNGTPIYIAPTGVNTNDSFLSFSVNLKDPDDPTYQCPMINQDTEFGNGDPAFRTGLYEFNLSYSYSDSATPASNKSEFSISFNVVDYRNYVEGSDASPFTFTNTNTFKVTKEGASEATDTNYEVYNYNYENAPTVEVDATKFAINFLYSANNVNYSFVYDKFAMDYDKNFIINKNLENGTKTGRIALKLKNRDLTYYINTYKKDDNKFYVAKFDIQDFLDEFLIPNKISTTFQGIYSFDLDFIVQSESENSASVEIIDKSLFPEIPIKFQIKKCLFLVFN